MKFLIQDGCGKENNYNIRQYIYIPSFPKSCTFLFMEGIQSPFIVFNSIFSTTIYKFSATNRSEEINVY